MNDSPVDCLNCDRLSAESESLSLRHKKTSLRMSFLYLLKEIKALSYVQFILPLKIYQQQADGISVKGLQSMQ